MEETRLPWKRILVIAVAAMAVTACSTATNTSDAPFPIAASLAPLGEEVVMPDLVGMSTGEALSALGEINAMMGTSTERSSEPEGTVLSQDPPAGTTVHPGTFVTVVVASPD